LITGQEKAIIKKYLENGEKLEGFKMLLSRCKSIETVNADLELIKSSYLKLKSRSLNSFSLVGRLKKQVNITLKARKKLEKHSYDLFTLDFLVVLGENI
jgi:hypothetical protein